MKDRVLMFGLAGSMLHIKGKRNLSVIMLERRIILHQLRRIKTQLLSYKAVYQTTRHQSAVLDFHNKHR